MAQSQGYPSVSDIATYLTTEGVEEITENNASYLTEFRQMLWRILQRSEGAAALSVYADADTTYKVKSGYYMWDGEIKTYAGSTSQNPTDNDTTYVWMTEANTISSAIDGTGWPSAHHLKLAEVVVDSDGNITNITDRRTGIGKFNLTTESGITTGMICAKQIATAQLEALLNTVANNLFSVNAGDLILEVAFGTSTAAGGACVVDIGLDTDAGAPADADGWIEDADANAANIYSSTNPTYEGAYARIGKFAAADGYVTITSSTDQSASSFVGHAYMLYIPA